jgi:hypothetical protein
LRDGRYLIVGGAGRRCPAFLSSAATGSRCQPREELDESRRTDQIARGPKDAWCEGGQIDNSGRLVIDIEQVSKIELNVGDEKEIGYVIAID